METSQEAGERSIALVPTAEWGKEARALPKERKAGGKGGAE